MSSWWRCDLQVASPGARDFHGPSDPPWDLQTENGRRLAAARYMDRVQEAGVEVIALADHNDAAWLEPMVEAGRDAGIVVFPGVEVTTGSGADGVHLIIIGDSDRTREDFNELLAAACGFGPDHPRFDPQDGTPASSPRTAIDILDNLPDGYLVIAPHAFNDNGVASSRTALGDIRWKILHHPRLSAVDVGDLRNLSNRESWRHKFAARELDHFPCLSYLAFVSTSDAYELGRIGERWSWIRMSTPTLEGLRQAFLDYEARIICDWDPRYTDPATPNDVSHGWVENVVVTGLSTSAEPVQVSFHPRLNVVIGGRGSGKSTIVAALRCLYGDPEGLPTQARTELRELLQNVFQGASAVARHRLPHSGEQQVARWAYGTGSVTDRPGLEDTAHEETTPTDFKVRIINQKELFERAAPSTGDPYVTSRNLLALVDDALATGSASPGGPAAFEASLDEAQTAWISAARAHQAEIEATAQREIVAARVRELQRQVEAFDSPASKSRRERNDHLIAQRDALDAATATFTEVLSSLGQDIEETLGESDLVSPENEMDPVAQEYGELNRRLSEIRTSFRMAVLGAVHETHGALTALAAQREAGLWKGALDDALADAARYRDELADVGVDPEEYERIRGQRAAQSQLLEELDERIKNIPGLEHRAVEAWAAVERLLNERRAARDRLLTQVAERSQLLRFSIVPRADVPQWTKQVRQLLNLRADGFLPDVPALGEWLWEDVPEAEQQRRSELWRRSCVTGDFTSLTQEAQLRSSWAERLTGLDPVLRARLGSQPPDEIVEMEFLSEDGDPGVEEDWKPLTAGSPGQRSAAMLSFVLHHGVEPLVLDQPEDDLDTEWITELVVRQLRTSRWVRQLVVVTHNANIPVNADAEQVIVMETHRGGVRIRKSSEPDGSLAEHVGALEEPRIRKDVQQIMEGGVAAFVRRELRYNNELNSYRAAMRSLGEPS